MVSIGREEGLQQQLDEALKVADYLKQKLDSLEDIVSELSDGQDVKAVFKEYSNDMEQLEKIVLEQAARRISSRAQLRVQAAGSLLETYADEVLQALHNMIGETCEPKHLTGPHSTFEPALMDGQSLHPNPLVSNILGPWQWEPTAIVAIDVLSAYSEVTAARLRRLENVLENSPYQTTPIGIGYGA
ncbi:hypothetical protein LTR27_009000 [Elasticomyces elasticus]|nr:hypothetical protein LTR27_009000 [Elasticomyces elasticus]